MTSHIVQVETTSAQYEIHIGSDALARAGEMLTPHLTRPILTIVTDENVANLHLQTLQDALADASIMSHVITLSAGEETKSFAQLEDLTQQLIALGIERNDLIAAFGGGVVGDLTGFAASILKRGCRYAQIPTTLLAQVDSSVGGKTAINVPAGKNLIGAFKQPEIVISDISVLSTLPARERAAGYAEIVKYGVIHDSAFFDWLESDAKLLTTPTPDAFAHAIARSCEIKAAIVGKDEFERGDRALLNYGHTFGHALEAACTYDGRLLHGEGVAIGMVLAAQFAERIAYCAPGIAERLETHLRSSGLPVRPQNIPNAPLFTADDLMAHMAKDKKVEAGAITLILPKAMGRARIVRDLSATDLNAFWVDTIQA